MAGSHREAASSLLKSRTASHLVLFYPPDPTTFLVQAGTPELFTYQTSNVYLTTSDGISYKTITVNQPGK